MLYGRAGELASLTRLVTGLGDGSGRALVVRGETGVGKTALLREVPVADPVRVIFASAVISEIDLAFSGLHQVLVPLGRPDNPVLRTAFGLSNGDTTDLAVCTATLELLRDAGREQPLLIVVDDAHELDSASRFVLKFCARRLSGLRVGIVLSTRDSDADGLPELTLRGLDAEPARELLTAHGWSHGAAMADAIVKAAGGNARILLELAQQPAGALLHSVVTGRIPAEKAVRHRFGARIESLSANARTALLVAAADDTGRREVVVGGGERLGVPPEVWDSAELTDLLSGHTFRHPLLRSAAYLGSDEEHRRAHAALADELADDPRRSRWHRALATTEPDEEIALALENDAVEVERIGGIASAAAVLRQSARLSGSPAQRARRNAMAAHSAWKSGNPTLARELLAAPGQPDHRVRAMVELFSGDQNSAFGFLRRAAASVDSSDGKAELRFMAVGAALHAGRLADAVQVATAIAGDPVYRQYGRWLAEAIEDRLTDPAATPWRVFDAAPPAVANSGAHRWLFPLAIATRGQHPREAREIADAAYRDLRAAGMLAIVPMPLTWLAELEFRLGHWAEARSHADEGVRLATDVDQIPRVADFAALLAQLAAARGDADETRHQAEIARKMARDSGNRLAAARAAWALGCLDLGNGEVRTAREHLISLVTPSSAAHHPQIAGLAVADLVEACVRAEDPETAATVLTGHSRWTTPDRVAWAHSHLKRATALLATGPDADKAYQEASTATDVETAPFDHARIALLHGQWLRRERRISEASRPLKLAADLFDRLGAQVWAQHADRELHACGEQRLGRVFRQADALTSQERQIAELAATGLSNREIGARLHLSHRTVGYHLHKVFPKLGITTRAQLRHWADTTNAT